MFVSCVQPYTTTTACTWPITSSQWAPSSSFDVCLSPVCSPTPQQLHVPGPSPPHNGPPVLPLTYVCLLCAALHHNNCMYLAHHLLTIGPQFQSQLRQDLSLVSVTFVDLVPKLRRLGTECFIRCLQKQRDGLTDCLANAKGTTHL